jgi:hypothetical protein
MKHHKRISLYPRLAQNGELNWIEQLLALLTKGRFIR